MLSYMLESMRMEKKNLHTYRQYKVFTYEVVNASEPYVYKITLGAKADFPEEFFIEVKAQIQDAYALTIQMDMYGFIPIKTAATVETQVWIFWWFHRRWIYSYTNTDTESG